MTTFLLVGSGYRTRLLIEVAGRLPDLSCLGVVVRTPREHSLPTFTELPVALRETRPDFVLLATPSAATPALIESVVRTGTPVLAETPPAPDLSGLRALWQSVGAAGLVQVAEQYLLMPLHAARSALVRSGVIGKPTQVQVSSTQTYHAVSIIRGLLDAGRGPVSVRASRFAAPLVRPLDRAGWTDDPAEHETTTTIATLDFGAGRSGVYDFVEGQTRNLLRGRRLLVRGSRGELADEQLIRIGDPRTLLRESLVRRQTGYDVDLNGFDTELISYGGEVLWRNPYRGQRWMDEEIAVATMLEATVAWVRGEAPEPYPLAEACQDHLLGLAIGQAATEDRTVLAGPEAWANTDRPTPE